MATKRKKHQNAPDEHVEIKIAESEGAESAGNATPPIAGADDATSLRREIDELQNKFLRAKAEHQNAARRAANERDETIRYANAGLIRNILEVLDDFDRALDAGQGAKDVSVLLDGVKLVRGKLDKVLTAQGVEAIEAENEPFDPTRHEALMQQPTAEHPPGTVVRQIQRGYSLCDRVLRPAKVVVASAPPEEDAGSCEPVAGEPSLGEQKASGEK